jgi:hypothetical protein
LLAAAFAAWNFSGAPYKGKPKWAVWLSPRN